MYMTINLFDTIYSSDLEETWLTGLGEYCGAQTLETGEQGLLEQGS